MHQGPECCGIRDSNTSSQVHTLGRGVLVDLEPILSLIVVGLRHDQCNVEVLPDRGGMLSNAVALRSGFNALSSFSIDQVEALTPIDTSIRPLSSQISANSC